jgi:hypothetical protein
MSSVISPSIFGRHVVTTMNIRIVRCVFHTLATIAIDYVRLQSQHLIIFNCLLIRIFLQDSRDLGYAYLDRCLSMLIELLNKHSSLLKHQVIDICSTFDRIVLFPDSSICATADCHETSTDLLWRAVCETLCELHWQQWSSITEFQYRELYSCRSLCVHELFTDFFRHRSLHHLRFYTRHPTIQSDLWRVHWWNANDI